MEGNGDNARPVDLPRNVEDVYMDYGIGSPVRARRSGLAFDISLENGGGPLGTFGSPGIKRVGDAPEQPAGTPLTAEQISEKLIAAEARREAAINELRNRCSEHNVVKVQQAIQKRSLAEKQQVEELKEFIDKEQETARANVEALRLAQLEKIKQQEQHHRAIQNRLNMEFEERVHQMDAKYAETNGKRDRILQEIVEKMKEHNNRVQEIHEKMTARSVADGPSDAVSDEQHEWINAANERDEYIRGAKERMRQANFDYEGDTGNVCFDQRHQ